MATAASEEGDKCDQKAQKGHLTPHGAISACLSGLSILFVQVRLRVSSGDCFTRSAGLEAPGSLSKPQGLVDRNSNVAAHAQVPKIASKAHLRKQPGWPVLNTQRVMASTALCAHRLTSHLGSR